MTSTDLSARDRDIRMLHWTDQGDSDWSATAPGGWDLYYAGARFGLRRGYSRYTSTVTLTRRGKAPASLVREGGFDRLAKRIGYAVEPQTGDADFDRRVYLITDDDALARALGDSPEARRAVLDLLDLDISRIDVTGNGFTIRLGESADPENDGGGALSNLALHLDALSDAGRTRRAPPGPDGGRGWAVSASAGSAWWPRRSSASGRGAATRPGTSRSRPSPTPIGWAWACWPPSPWVRTPCWAAGGRTRTGRWP
ncbi:hypothetical protein [Caulobacter sp. UNC358MFTsu5.1]|uniref:hypothetical protein n=1 Tax=Caulobacter sp. UNC358MFTsu5.1 TaxID=1449049 RepID=UPI0012DE17EE|nr:hypothetical protein [Caulobacter sp. UNC358MFTsu5.1]